jgi:hypothetical protein
MTFFISRRIPRGGHKQPRFLQMLDSATRCPLSEASPAKGIDATAHNLQDFGTSRWQLERDAKSIKDSTEGPSVAHQGVLGRGCLRRYQGSRSQRDWLDQPWGITHNQNA